MVKGQRAVSLPTRGRLPAWPPFSQINSFPVSLFILVCGLLQKPDPEWALNHAGRVKGSHIWRLQRGTSGGEGIFRLERRRKNTPRKGVENSPRKGEGNSPEKGEGNSPHSKAHGQLQSREL
uniref:Uncharacterized protein n=1 Tax=Pipistrellus kuhlii TaxID=59472 RepID=A0A7J8A970_PIPKU|nr:hypothetical protein mPipKuh1_008872 [Pipistrellus kuhlii]